MRRVPLRVGRALGIEHQDPRALIQPDRAAALPILRDLDQAQQPRHPRLPTLERLPEPPLCGLPHQRGDTLVRHGHEGVRPHADHLPGQGRHLPAAEPRHDGVEVAAAGSGLPGARAAQQAIGLLRLDDHRHRTTAAQPLPQVPDRRRGQTAYPALDEDVGGREPGAPDLAVRPVIRGGGNPVGGHGWACHTLPCSKHTQHLLHHDRVSHHHHARDLHVSRIGRVRDHRPPVLAGVPVGPRHRIVVLAVDAHHAGAERTDRRGPHLGHVARQVDHGVAAEHRRAPRDRPAVIAVRRACDGDPGRGRTRILAWPPWSPSAPRHVPDPVRTAQRLEAAEPETAALILHPNRLQPQPRCQTVRGTERRRPVSRPGCNLCLGRLVRGRIDDRPEAAREGPGRFDIRVQSPVHG